MFHFACAKKLYRTGKHPRVMVDEGGLEEIRKKINNGIGKNIYRALRNKVNPLVGLIEDTKDIYELTAHPTLRRKSPEGDPCENIDDIALVGVLDHDRRIIDTAIALLKGIPGSPGPDDTYSAGYASWGNTQIAYDLLFPFMSDADRRALAEWLVENSVRNGLRMFSNACYLKCAGANVPLVGMVAGMLSLLVVEGDPGVPGLETERQELMIRFEASLFASQGPEGYPAEDIGYGTGTATLLSRVAEALRRAGYYDVYRTCPNFVNFGNAMLHMIQPWGQVLSNTGDYGADYGFRGLTLPRIAAETDNAALLWLHSTLTYPIASSGPTDMERRRKIFPDTYVKGFGMLPVNLYTLLVLNELKKPVHPSKARIPTQYMDPERGIVTFRSSWRDDATFVVFDGAQRSSSAQGHAHDSGGHFSLSALGEYFAIDTGRYGVEQCEHNVVLANGRPGHLTEGQWHASPYHANLTEYKPGEFVDVARVDYSQMSDTYWSYRWLGLVKNAGKGDIPSYVWTVEDVNFESKLSEFHWLFNTHPDNKVSIRGKRVEIRGCNRGNLLDIFFALPFPAEYPECHTIELEKEIFTCQTTKYLEDPAERFEEYRKTVGNCEYGPVLQRPGLKAVVKGYNGRFMSLMIPRKKGNKLPKVKRLQSLPDSLAVRITFDDFADTIVFAYTHGLLETGGISARGRWCVVRKSLETGKTIASACDGVGFRTKN